MKLEWQFITFAILIDILAQIVFQGVAKLIDGAYYEYSFIIIIVVGIFFIIKAIREVKENGKKEN